MRLDGNTLDVAEVAANAEACGRSAASRELSAFAKLRFVSLVEGGTHVLFGTRMGAYAESELALSRSVLGKLREAMHCLADRNSFGYRMRNMAWSTGTDPVWRRKKNRILPCERHLRDGSCLSTAYASQRERRKATGARRCGWRGPGRSAVLRRACWTRSRCGPESAPHTAAADFLESNGRLRVERSMAFGQSPRPGRQVSRSAAGRIGRPRGSGPAHRASAGTR